MTQRHLRKFILRIWIACHDAPPPRAIVRQMVRELRTFLDHHR